MCTVPWYSVWMSFYPHSKSFSFLTARKSSDLLRSRATNRKVAGSIPANVSGFFIDIKSFWSHYGPGVDSASNRNEYQEYFLGKGSWCVRLTTFPPSCAIVMKSGNLNFLEPSGPVQACNRNALPFTRKMGDCCPIKWTCFSPERENAVLQWVFKLNTAPAAAAMWDSKGHMIKVNDISEFKIPATIDIKALTWNCTCLGWRVCTFDCAKQISLIHPYNNLHVTECVLVRLM